MSIAARSAGRESSRLHGAVPCIDLPAQHRAIAREIRDAVEAVFDEQQFILGDVVAALECDIAEYCDSLHAVSCGCGTDALLLSLLALGIGPGDEVVTSPFTSVATAAAIHRAGARITFADIDPVSFHLDPARVEAALTPRSRAIVPVHLFGQCADMEPLFRMAVRKRLAIVEDACQSLGAEYHGRRAGVLGTTGCFSFSPDMNLGGAGEGGMITTDDADLAARLRRLRGYDDAPESDDAEVGLNSRLDALQAAVLRVKLRHLEAWTQSRQENARRYRELFRHYELLDAVELPEVLPGRRHVFHRFCVRIRGGRRDAVLKHLRQNTIGAEVYYSRPLHLHRAFAALGYGPGDFPQAEAAAREVLALPIIPELQPTQLETVVRQIAGALGRDATGGSYPGTRLPVYSDALRKRAA